MLHGNHSLVLCIELLQVSIKYFYYDPKVQSELQGRMEGLVFGGHAKSREGMTEFREALRMEVREIRKSAKEEMIEMQNSTREELRESRESIKAFGTPAPRSWLF